MTLCAKVFKHVRVMVVISEITVPFIGLNPKAEHGRYIVSQVRVPSKINAVSVEARKLHSKYKSVYIK